MMTVLLGRMALLLSGLLLLPLLLIRAQPYDDSGLRDFLTPPEDCPAPCFMGIRPGVTRDGEATRILSEHPWVTLTSPDNSQDRYLTVSVWQWTEIAPAWIDHRANLIVFAWNGEVTKMNVKVTIPWGHFMFAFGKPERYTLDFLDRYTLISAAGRYADQGIVVAARGICSAATIYDWPVALQFTVVSPDSTSESPPLPMTNCR